MVFLIITSLISTLLNPFGVPPLASAPNENPLRFVAVVPVNAVSALT
jgi:hypothetical protein